MVCESGAMLYVTIILKAVYVVLMTANGWKWNW